VAERAPEEALGEKGRVARNGGPGGLVHGRRSALDGEPDADALVEVEEGGIGRGEARLGGYEAGEGVEHAGEEGDAGAPLGRFAGEADVSRKVGDVGSEEGDLRGEVG
jgi:hypothetical protein